MRLGCGMGCVVLLGMTGTVTHAGIIHVDDDATGLNDGSTWSDAFVHLQDALAAAQSGDQIWVARGTYNPDQGAAQTPGDPGHSFELRSDVALYGGPSAVAVAVMTWPTEPANPYEKVWAPPPAWTTVAVATCWAPSP